METGDGVVDIARREFVKLFVVTKYYNGNINGAENRELVSLLEKAAFTLEKGTAGRRVSRGPRAAVGQHRHGGDAVEGLTPNDSCRP